MKRYLIFGTFIVGITISLLLFLSSCEKDGDSHKPKPNPDPTTCSTMGTLKSVSCGTSLLNGYWILLDNGKYVQPCELGVVIQPEDYREGTRVKFGYKKIQYGSCDSLFACTALTPEATKAKITCLQVVSQPEQPGECSLKGTVRKKVSYGKDCVVSIIETQDGMQYEPQNQELLDEYANNQCVYFSFYEVQTMDYKFAPTCSGLSPIEINCIRPCDGGGDPGGCRAMVTGDDPIGVVGNVLSATIIGNCLKVKIGYGGCGPETTSYRFNLVWDGRKDAGKVNLVLSDGMYDKITCMAYFEDEFSFDLSNLKTTPNEVVKIHLSGYDQVLTY